MQKKAELADKIGQILTEINGKKELLTRTQKELEHKIHDLDKLLDLTKEEFQSNSIKSLKTTEK